jgi:hypothetical protein
MPGQSIAIGLMLHTPRNEQVSCGAENIKAPSVPSGCLAASPPFSPANFEAVLTFFTIDSSLREG